MSHHSRCAREWTAMVGIVVLGMSANCRSTQTYRTVDPAVLRNSMDAQRRNAEGLEHVSREDWMEAEQSFRKALSADVYYAPAHNNLGLVLLETERYYEAAWEFDYAAKLAPRSPEPRQNLALLFEELGRTDQAIEEYEGCLKIDANNVSAMRQLARVYVKTGRRPDRLQELLEALLLVPDGGPWDVWARGQMIRLGRNDTLPAFEPSPRRDD